MLDTDVKETEAIQHGGRMGGEYLNSIGKFDLAVLSDEEWNTFLRCVVVNYSDKLASLEAASLTLPARHDL